MEVKTLVVLAGLVVLATACGSAGIAPGSSPSPSSSAGLGYDVTATNTDHAVTLHVGQKLEVVLRAGPGMNNWTRPMSSHTSVLGPIVDPAATAAIGVTLAAFEAISPGEADVTANSSPKCPPDQACPMFIAVYGLKVTVTP